MPLTFWRHFLTFYANDSGPKDTLAHDNLKLKYVNEGSII